MSLSQPSEINLTDNGKQALNAKNLAEKAQKMASENNNKLSAETEARLAREEANAQIIKELNDAQSDFESNLAWTKSQIYEGQHQNDSAVNSLRSDMNSSWNSMTSAENSLYASASTATSEADSRLESLRTQNSQSLVDLHSAADSLHAVASNMRADADSMRASLATTTSDLGKDITATRDSLTAAKNSLAAVDSNMRTATSETASELASTRSSLAAVDAGLRGDLTKAGNDLADAKTSLAATGNSLATATSELQRKTGQLSGSLSTADSMIMYNSSAIAEVKRTAGEISTTISNIRVGGRNLLTNTKSLSDVWSGDTETVDGFTAAKATQTGSGIYDPIQWGGLSLKSNTDYVLTFYAKASKQTVIYSYLYDIGTDSDYMDGSTPNTLTTDYQRYTIHFHTAAMPAGRTVDCLPVRLAESGVTAWIYGVQLEEGNTATQWQPNPADTDQAISEVSQTADAIRADLTNTKGDVATVKATANSLQSQITDNKNNISSVKQTAQGLTTRVSNAEGNVSGLQQTAKSLQSSVSDNAKNISSVKQTATALQSSMTNAQGEISNVKQTASKLQSDLANAKGDISSLQQTASGLTSRVGNAEGNISQLQQTANGLTSTVSNLKVGGRNLLGGDTKTEHTAGYPASGNTDMTSFTMLIPANQTQYTLSFDAKSTHAGDSITCYLYNSIEGGHDSVTDGENNQGVKNQNCDGNMPFTLTDSYQRYWVKWTNNPNDGKLTVLCGRLFAWAGSGSVSIKNIKLEVGNTPTDWTPAPETFDESISQLQQTADRIKAQVNDNKGNISSVTQTANAVKTDLANAKGDVSLLQQTANKLTSDMANAKGNITSLQQTATGLQSTVQSQSGQISQLQQDADGLNFTVANGSQNLILNSGNPSTLEGWFTTGNLRLQSNPFWKSGTENLFVLSNTSSTYEKFLISSRFQIEPNQDYTLSFYAFNNYALRNADVWYLPRKSGSSNDFDATIQLQNNVKYATSTAQRVKITFNSGDYNEGCIRFDNNSSTTEGTGAELWLTDIQLEKGKIATAWHPSPDDIAQLKLTADALTSKVADTQGNVSNLQLTASNLQTQITNNKNDVASLQVTAGGIRTDLTNAKNDIASVRVKADSLTTSMANANDQISTLQHRADSLTSTISNGGVNLLNNSQGKFQPNTSEIDNYQRFDGVNVYMTQGQKYTVSAQCGPAGFYFSGSHVTTEESNRILLWLVDNGVNQVISSDTTDISMGGTHFTWNEPTGTYTLRVNSYKTDNSGYAYHVQIEYGDTATPWQPSNGDISSLQQTAQGLTADMKDAKGNISNLQVSAGQLTTDMTDAKKNVSSLQLTAKELDTQIKAVDGRATTIKTTADGISARVSGIENSKAVGSLLKLTGNEAGLGSFVNDKLIAGINTNPDGVCIEGKNIHISGQTHIDDGVINASKITVYNTVGDNKGNQYLAVAWGQLNSTIGGKDDKGNTLWGSINQTKDKFSSYYTKQEADSKNNALQASLIKQTSDNIVMAVNDAQKFPVYTLSASSQWDFNYTKSIHENWFVKGDPTTNYFHNGPDGVTPWVYVTSRGSADGTRFVTTVWKDNDPTQYQRTWTGDHWTPWVAVPNTSNMVSAINMSPDGIKIDGKYLELNSNTRVNGDFTVRGENIELNGATKVTGRLDLMQKSANSVAQDSKYHNPWNWNNAHIYFDNYLQLLAEGCTAWYTDTKTSLSHRNAPFYSIATLTPGYLKFTTYDHKINITDENFDGQISRSYLDSGRLETPEVYTDKFVITGHHIRVRDNQYLMVTNKNGTNFDDSGSVGFQVYGGIVLGRQTIGSPTKDIYFQQGNVDGVLNRHYSDAPKVTLHAQNVISQTANTVSSRLSVKTDITPVTYDRALAAVEGTDMYDYRYISDDSGQHYVSSIIDDVHPTPEYNMDTMLINKERTARIDANLLGYHHVVLQELLKKIDKLQIELNELKSKEK